MYNLTNIGFKIMKIGHAKRVEINFFENCEYLFCVDFCVVLFKFQYLNNYKTFYYKINFTIK